MVSSGSADGGQNAGAAYLFARDQGGPGQWGQVHKLTASDWQAADDFGLFVAIDGDSAIVGARNEDAGGSAAGAAYVFDRDQGGAGQWGEVAKLMAMDAQAVDWFGTGVAIGGVKTVSLALLVLAVVATMRRRERVEAFSRTIAMATMRRAAAVVVLMGLVISCFTLLLCYTVYP